MMRLFAGVINLIEWRLPGNHGILLLSILGIGIGIFPKYSKLYDPHGKGNLHEIF